MSFGLEFGSAITSYGLCLTKTHNPLSSKNSLKLSALSSNFESFLKLIFLSALIFNSSTFLRSPRTISEIFPETGEANLTRSEFLSKKSISPALTLSFSLTSNLGNTP